MLDYQGGVVFEWQKRLLAEQALVTTNDMEVGVPATMGPPPSGLQPANSKNPPGSHIGPSVRGRQGLPIDGEGVVEGTSSNHGPLHLRRSRGSGNPSGGGRGRGNTYANTGPMQGQPFGGRTYGQYSAYGDGFPSLCGPDPGSYSSYGYSHEYGPRHNQ